MPSSKFLLISLVAASLLQHADGASNCRVSGRYSIADAPTMKAQSQHNHQHVHSNKPKHSHTVPHPPAKASSTAKAQPATKGKKATKASPATKTNPATKANQATKVNQAAKSKPTTKANQATNVKPAVKVNPATTASTAATADPVTTSAATLPTNILKNPGFDEADAYTGQYDGAPAWFQLLEGEVKAATNALPAVSGNHFLHFNLVDEGLRASIMQDIDGIDTSKRYTASLWLKVTSEHGDYRDGSCWLDITLGYQKVDDYKLSTTYPSSRPARKGDDGAAWVQHSTAEFAIEDSSNLLFSVSSACGPDGRDLHVYLDSIVLQESHPAARGGQRRSFAVLFVASQPQQDELKAGLTWPWPCTYI